MKLFTSVKVPINVLTMVKKTQDKCQKVLHFLQLSPRVSRLHATLLSCPLEEIYLFFFFFGKKIMEGTVAKMWVSCKRATCFLSSLKKTMFWPRRPHNKNVWKHLL